MKLFRIIYLLFAVILFTTSCSRTNEKLLQAEQLVESSPDSAMAILNKLEKNQLYDQKNQSYLSLVKAKILINKKSNYNIDSLLKNPVEYFYKNPEKNRLSECYFYLGRTNKFNMNYDKAMDYYLKSIDNLRDLNDYILLGRLNMDIGEIYYYQNDFSNALKKFHNADVFFINAGMQPQSFSCKMNVGRCYKADKKYSTSLQHNIKTMKFATDSFQKGSVLQEIGLNYYKMREFDSALHYLKKVLNFPNYEKNYSVRYYHLADLLFEIKQYDSAFFYAKETLNLNPDIRTRKECYRLLVNCKTIEGDIQRLNYYMSKYQDCDDSIRKIDLQTKGSYIETMHNTQKEVTKSHSWIWYLSVFVFLIIASSILLYIRKHKKNVLDMKIAEEKQIQQKAELRQEVVAKSRKAVETTIKERRDEVMSSLKNNNPEFRRKLLNKLYGEVIHFNDKVYFKKEMDAIMNNLYSKLESRYPELKEKEIQWACLYELNVSRDDIMDLLDFNLESYKKMRQRFAQKTEIQYIKSIDDLLESILTE
jgi:tetratricopeptide (TPR) repeat protein